MSHSPDERTRRHHAHITMRDSRYSMRRKARYVIAIITTATAIVRNDSMKPSMGRTGVRGAPNTRRGKSKISSIQMIAIIARKPAASSVSMRRDKSRAFCTGYLKHRSEEQEAGTFIVRGRASRKTDFR